MGTSIKLSANSDGKQLYGDPASVMVRKNTMVSGAPKFTGCNALSNDFRGVDCGGFTRYIDQSGSNDIWKGPPYSTTEGTYTFAKAFSSAPVVVVGVSSSWKYPDAAFTALSVSSTTASNFKMKFVNGTGKGTSDGNTTLIVGPQWIAVGPDTGA